MLYSCMNNTKWEEIRLAMVNLAPPPKWKTTSLDGYESIVDGEWYYHFRLSGYSDIQYLDVLTHSAEQHATVGAILRTIHLPGIETSTGFRVFGYAEATDFVNYL